MASRRSGSHEAPLLRPSRPTPPQLLVQTLSPARSFAHSTRRRDARAWGVPPEGRQSQLDSGRADAEVPFTEAERLAVEQTWAQVMSTCRCVCEPLASRL